MAKLTSIVITAGAKYTSSRSSAFVTSDGIEDVGSVVDTDPSYCK